LGSSCNGRAAVTEVEKGRVEVVEVRTQLVSELLSRQFARAAVSDSVPSVFSQKSTINQSIEVDARFDPHFSRKYQPIRACRSALLGLR